MVLIIPLIMVCTTVNYCTSLIMVLYILALCPESWVQGIHGSCYKFSSNTLGWNSAKSACEALGSKLVMLNSQAEQQLLAPKVTEKTWIGLHRDPNDKSRWLWVDGSPATVTNWKSGEPNDQGGTEDCVQMFPTSLPHAGKWNDRPCVGCLRYVCEISRKSELICL